MSILLVIDRSRKRDGDGIDPEKLHHYGQVASLVKSAASRRHLRATPDTNSRRLRRPRGSPDDAGAVGDRYEHGDAEQTDGAAGGTSRPNALVLGDHADDQRAERRHAGEGHR